MCGILSVICIQVSNQFFFDVMVFLFYNCLLIHLTPSVSVIAYVVIIIHESGIGATGWGAQRLLVCRRLAESRADLKHLVLSELTVFML